MNTSTCLLVDRTHSIHRLIRDKQSTQKWSSILLDLTSQNSSTLFHTRSTRLWLTKASQTMTCSSVYSIRWARPLNCRSRQSGCARSSLTTRTKGCSTLCGPNQKAYSTTLFSRWFCRRAGHFQIRQRPSKTWYWSRSLSCKRKSLKEKDTLSRNRFRLNMRERVSLSQKETCL